MYWLQRLLCRLFGHTWNQFPPAHMAGVETRYVCGNCGKVRYDEPTN
jgi:hypothetical protein